MRAQYYILGIIYYILCTAVSCSYIRSIKYRKYPPNPFADIKKVAVLPILNESTTQIRREEFEHILASEMVKFQGFDVVRPRVVFSVIAGTPDIQSEKNLKWLGKTLGVDAILQVKIMDYDPYYPPRITVFTNFIKTTTAVHTSVEEIDQLIRTPTWIMSKLSRDVAPFVINQFEQTFDTHHAPLRNEIIGYYHAHEKIDYAFNEPGNSILYVQKNLWNFVCTRIIRQIIEAGVSEPQGGTVEVVEPK